MTRLVGETATIFQRMNDKGDMLRVATTVMTSENKRAIGTYIPAVNPDGTNNPVISSILRGETYHGRAYVVNAWYLTAYAPVKDMKGNLVGMLYVGVKQKAVESRVRHSILKTKVGKTGYVYVLGGRGEERGRYIISDKGSRDGEDIWLNKDSDGHYVIQKIINKAVALKQGEMTTVRYRWQNPGEETPRWKVARLAYYRPWDWVIGTSVYEDELQAYQTLLSEGRLRMIRIMSIAGIIITCLFGMIAVLITWKITHPVRQMTRVAEKIIEGDLNQAVEVKPHDEIGVLAHTFNLMTSKLKQSIESLSKSEENYRGIFENAVEGLFQNTIEGKILSSNPALANILGYDSPEALITSINDIGQQVYVNPEKRDELIATMLKHGEAFKFEAQFYRKDREKIWVHINARLVRDNSGKPAFIEGFITNITEQKKAEEEKNRFEARLSQAQKMEAIGTLAGGIAHDFNNILSAIIGYAELAMYDITDIDKARGYLGEVIKAGNRAKELVKQILTFSRMMESEYLPIALSPVIKESLKMLRSVIPSNIEIRQDINISGLVMSDPNHINQIMINLCTNAVHAMDETGGILEVILQEITMDNDAFSNKLDLSPGSYLKIIIRDTGKGISPEVIDRIFEPYFTTKGSGRGTGLGLSVIHGIVKSHNGTITCKSVLHEGTTFEVYLPRVKSAHIKEEPHLEIPLPGGNERILFIDDEEVLAELAVKMLSSRGYTVVPMTNSISALELFREDPQGFDLVITDMTMPCMTGDRLAQELIAIRHDIPVILCTGYSENITEEKAKKIGIREFILKPLDIRTLSKTVRKVLNER